MSDFLFVYVTVPSCNADVMARILVKERLAACVNLLPNMRSFYMWEGKETEAEEVVLIAKTKTELFDALSARIKEIHPYEIPCVVAWPVEQGLPDFLKWINESI